MKILRIANIPDNRTGGMSRAMYGTGDALQAMGHEVSYLYSDKLPQFHSIRLKLLRRLLLSLRLPTIVRQLEKQQGRFDVIEIHEPLAAFCCWLRCHGFDLPPVVIFSHGLEERSFAAEVAYRQMKGQSFSRKEKVSSQLTVVQSKYAVRHADQVLCCNSQDFDYLQQQGVSPQRLTLHFNGVETEVIIRGQVASQHRAAQLRARRAILFVGSWLERKGILDLIPALNSVLSAFPDATFTAAGCAALREDVIQDFAPEVHSQVQTISSFEGDDALAAIYQAHDIFVLSSIFEGQPLVMIEAAAFGLALVTTNICGMIDFIETGRNGLTVPVGDEKALAEALTRCCQDGDLVRALGDAAQATARQHTWALSARNVAAAYEKAVAAGRKSAGASSGG